MTKQIELTRGQVALVDDDLYDYLSQWKWCTSSDGYAIRGTKNRKLGIQKRFLMHREVIGAEPGQFVDHKDGNKLNNQISNLRFCTYSENSMNKKAKSRTGYKGVSKHSKSVSPRWQAEIETKTERIYLGLFKSPEEAALAYNAAAIKHFGEFARLNEIKDR